MIELLGKKHDRSSFDCGKELLNNYLKYQAGQDVKRRLSACFVLNDSVANYIQGYYTLANSSIPLGSFPEHIQKKLPKSYLAIPATLLCRLAVDKRDQGKGIGKILLIDALKRAYEATKVVASFAVVVDPIDEAAVHFYGKYDFITLPDSGRMFIATMSLKELFE
jgi:ribosomal protein S18 acetylase RimI-like enzyme